MKLIAIDPGLYVVIKDGEVIAYTTCLGADKAKHDLRKLLDDGGCLYLRVGQQPDGRIGFDPQAIGVVP